MLQWVLRLSLLEISSCSLPWWVVLRFVWTFWGTPIRQPPAECIWVCAKDRGIRGAQRLTCLCLCWCWLLLLSLCPDMLQKDLGQRPEGSDADYYNRAMNRCRTSVEWGFGLTAMWCPYTTVAAYAKIGCTSTGAHYRDAICMTNLLSCLRGNITSNYFRCMPPKIENYVNHVADRP